MRQFNIGDRSLPHPFTDVDKRLYDKVTDIAFSAKVHFLKKIIIEEGGFRFTAEPSNNLFLLYCAANNITWALEALVEDHGEFISIRNMHKESMLDWYVDTVQSIISEIHTTLVDWTKEGKSLTTYAPATTKMINDVLTHKTPDMLGIRGAYGTEGTHHIQRQLSDIDMVDTVLLHEMYQIDDIGKKKYRVNKSAGAVIDRQAIGRLLSRISPVIYPVSGKHPRNKEFMCREYEITMQYVVTLCSFVSKLFTHTHIRGLCVPSSENTTYRQWLFSVMHAIGDKAQDKSMSRGHGSICTLHKILCRLKKYKCLLSTHPMLRTVTPVEAIVFGHSAHIPCLNIIEKTTVYDIHELNKTLDIVLNNSGDFYMLFSLLYSDLVECGSNLSQSS